MRIAWRTVGSIITCYWADTAAAVDAFAGLRKIGIDEIRLITRVAFGFKSPDALIALAMLNLGGHKPVLPGRS